MSSNKNNEGKNESNFDNTKVLERIPEGSEIKGVFTDPETRRFKVPENIYREMDSNNKKAADVWETEGQAAVLKHMFTDNKTGGTLSYAEMRSRYG